MPSSQHYLAAHILSINTAIKYDAAIHNANDQIVTTITNINLFPRYFQNLRNNTVLHDDLVLAYLKLLESTGSYRI